MKRFSISCALRAAPSFALYAAAAFVVGAACEATKRPTEPAAIDLISNEVILEWNVIAPLYAS